MCKKLATLALIFVLFVLCSVSCQKNKGDGGMVDMSQYQSELTTPYLRKHSGRIEDGQSDMLCSYKGKTYSLTFYDSTEMICSSSETDEQADCSSADIAVIKLKGELIVEGIEESMVVHADIDAVHSQSISSPKKPLIIQMIFQTEMTSEFGEIFAHLQDIEIGELGERISTFEWSMNHSVAENSSNWETCIGQVDD